MTELHIPVPPALLDALADRVAARLRDDEPQPTTEWLRGAKAIAGYLGCQPQRVYDLVCAGKLRVDRDGSTLMARRSDLDAYLRGER